ncbi:helix-turn-helix transcriptional regulator [Candidatus Fukatsuia symbiotica]|uniref:Transcriptional regulator n=1 Tax=Candidatus Fukatsuia symbiotica TaxID=1878942 RepID=A0A2U8I346_9GAMM|nr:helix-turn-helix transcriptional regulator [Candidatus Fukatsuia symbiotica]AWK13540.1 transcriptional regulator [Candidatus Fukatsuia symbiotica]MEA9445331.1 helix-turn-helix transcriptional regulator [Candidatus Fukatsuia symbiotica]
MTKLQYINDETGKPLYVLLPVTDYEKLVDNTDDDYESVPYKADHHDDEIIPHDVISIMVNQDISLIAAWRIYLGMSQYEVAEKLQATQSAVSQWESVDSTPQKKTRKKLAALYGCRLEQMTL